MSSDASNAQTMVELKLDEGKAAGSNLIFGNYDGPKSMYVKLVSSDGHEFVVQREHVLASSTLKNVLNGPEKVEPGEMNVVHLREIPSHVLQKVCHYFAYTNSEVEIPDFAISPEAARWSW